MAIEDCTQHRFPWDYAHINTIEDADGDYVASLRGCSQVVRIDGETGEVIWRLGRSNRSDADWIAGAGTPPVPILGDPYGEFCGQHSATLIENGNLIMFDNGGHCVVDPATGESQREGGVFSRVVEYSLDRDSGTGQLVGAIFQRHHSLHSGFNRYARSQGHVEPMPNGHWLISWGRGTLDDDPNTPLPPDESITQVNPLTGEEVLSVIVKPPDEDFLFPVRAYPLSPVALADPKAPLMAEISGSPPNSGVHTVPSDTTQVVVVFNQPVVDFTAATPSVSVQGATVTSVAPHIMPGEPANAYLFTLTPTGGGPITFALVAGQSCASGGICGAAGTLLTPPPPPPTPPTPTPPTGGSGGGGGGGPRQTVPDAPTNLVAKGTDGAVALSWEAPENDGGTTITNYQYRIDGKGGWISIGSTDTTHTVTGLVNGTEYTFQVRAVSRVGRSQASGPAKATPRAPAVLDFTHFANGDSTISEMVLVNVAPYPIQPTLYFYDQEGTLIDPEAVVDITGDLEIAEDGSLSVSTEMEPLGELTIASHGRGEPVSGSVKVVSDGPIGGFLRFDLPDIGVAGVGASAPVQDALFPARRQAGGIRTAAALHNLEAEAMGVSCRLMRGGVALEAAEIPLEANGQTAWFIEDVFTATDTSDFAGSVRCIAPGRGRFTAIAAEMDAAGGIFTTLPVMEVNRGRAEATTLDFAHFANGTLDHRSGVREPGDPAERSRSYPLPYGHSSDPARYLFLRHRGHPG